MHQKALAKRTAPTGTHSRGRPRSTQKNTSPTTAKTVCERIAQRNTTPGGTRPITAITLRIQEHWESQCQPRKQTGNSQQQHDANHSEKTIREYRYCAASCHPGGRQETVKDKGAPSTAKILDKSIAQRGATPGDKHKSHKINTIPITEQKMCKRIAGSSASSEDIQKTVKNNRVMTL